MFFRLFTLSTAIVATAAHAQEFPSITALPPLEIPDSAFDEQAMAELGEMLFFDTRLSGDASTSCASCHDPDAGWGDASDLARGYPGTMHWRNSQTLVNAAYLNNGLHWDGTVPSLKEQVPGAMGTSVVSNMHTMLAEERLRQIPEYVELFDNVWGEKPDIDKMSSAIAAFERTLISNDSPFDRFMAGDAGAMDAAAKRGMQVFEGKGNCVSCHNGPLGTDLQFYNTSVPPNPAFVEDPLRQVTFRTMMRGFGIERAVYETFDRDPGRYLATRDTSDLGAMRTPPLRYLTFTAPYMHNGMFYTLDEVVDFYDQGGTEDVFGTKSPRIVPLGLTDQEKSDLVAFLESLSGSEVKVDYPELPDYELASFPMSTEVRAIATAPVPQTTAAVAPLQTAPAGPSSQVMTITLDADLPEEFTGGEQPATEVVRQAATVITENGQRYAIVKDGDTLGTLAEDVYGDVLQYRKIYGANRELISDPNALVVGTRLVLPE